MLPCSCSYFMTRTPFLVAASTSTLSTPVPALPTTCSLSAASSTSAVTLVAERTMSPSQSWGDRHCGWDQHRGWWYRGGLRLRTASAGGCDPPCETGLALASDGRRGPAPPTEGGLLPPWAAGPPAPPTTLIPPWVQPGRAHPDLPQQLLLAQTGLLLYPEAARLQDLPAAGVQAVADQHLLQLSQRHDGDRDRPG